ncbi:MAG: TM0106 family RecB-like putative nuclease, partial [Gemmatimonadetes bacterium]|nr:TM0106 family RecB-like putative nuclease [Gemmatimonadota bacterium]
AETLAAMRGGADAVYQAVLFDGTWLGYADFLQRVDGPSALGDFSYEVADTKLARRVKAGTLLQLCVYSEQLACLQGVMPEKMHVVLGGMDRQSFALSDFTAYHRRVKSRFEEFVRTARVQLSAGQPVATYPDPVEHCAVCRWLDTCLDQRHRDDHLSLVAEMRRDQTRKLGLAGIQTVAALAASQPGAPVRGIGTKPLERLRHQARLQVLGRLTGELEYDPIPEDPELPGRGLRALPLPSPGDLFFDMEGDPFVAEGGLEYLFGVLEVVDGAERFQPFWAHDRSEEKVAFERFVDLVMDRLVQHPDLHVYHYASYEPSALKRLAGIHVTREEEVDRILRGDVLVDLYQVVRQGVRVATESYSLKKLEPLFMPARHDAIQDAASSIARYEEWIRHPDPGILEAIADYNRADCVSTRKLRAWLEERRLEVAARLGRELGRRERRDPEPSKGQSEAEAQTAALVQAVMEGVPDLQHDRTPEQHVRWLLAQLLGWHRRENRVEWQDYYRRCGLAEDLLVEDSAAIGGLEYEGVVGTVAKSDVHRYRFEPQDNKILVGKEVHDAARRKSAGKVHAIDNEHGLLDLRRGKKSKKPHPRAVVPTAPIFTTEQREAIARVARWVLTNGIDAPGPYRAIRDLLLRNPPRRRTVAPREGVIGVAADPREARSELKESLTASGELPLTAALRLVRELDGGCLPVQGPPGSGKTYAGAAMILELVATGKVVGVTGYSHSVIRNLLEELCRQAGQRNLQVRIVQKAEEDDACVSPMVECIETNEEVEVALDAGRMDVVAGTAWLFARAQMEGRLDTLFVDEAGQVSLANVAAVAGAARNLVLLGDPQQLAQPSKGSHPPGAELSALEHVLDGRATMPPGLGLFLETTRRLHPKVCTFVSEVVYEGRLTAEPFCGRQDLAEVANVSGVGPRDGSEPTGAISARARAITLGGTGLRYLPVEHAGNRSVSTEEVEIVRAAAMSLLGRSWTDQRGDTRPLEPADILVLAPYNAQVAALAHEVPKGVRVGTVDKFQGQQAPVAFYSMASSSAEDLPRNMEFLYSLNRLNVAVSRAQGLAVLICSPKLLDVRCRTPQQMRLANALCRFVE